MATSSENIKLWMNQAEPDYYLHFLKVWIPFNAWYVDSYPSLKRKDTDIINELQNTASEPKKIIKNFLDNNGHEALEFQKNLAELHFQLDANSINHNGSRLSFKSLYLMENPVKHKNDKDKIFNIYKVEKTTHYFQAYIEAKGGKVLLDFKQSQYEIEDLTKDIAYIKLDKKIQRKIYNLYEEINPKKAISIICNQNSSKKDCIALKSENSCKLIKDTETIAKACIKVLYALRCMLFHGEIAPTETNRKIYKNASCILQLIINKLK
ncbi:MAG: hypothetical protein EZS26_001471 [Candidatus Ordinivivax streblomastigis]|uniref:Apea-like HEPN domain-containing protein n=1 Tax=Candidatus Ordinivivax streblomastigis TaxID=2540710 RepID=A0A5M8P1U5_9BACT|nr:MAG: hypothetical protein EZS26_001471 [Candidatus Ordinivivax streblomastigis]